MVILMTPIARGIMVALSVLLGPGLAVYGVAEDWNMGQAMVAWALYGIAVFALATLLIRMDPEA